MDATQHDPEEYAAFLKLQEGEQVRRVEQRKAKEAWGAKQVELAAVLLHLPTGVIGKARKFWEVYYPPGLPETMKPVDAPVIEVGPAERSNAFLCEPSAFVVLSPAEANFAMVVAKGLSEVLGRSLGVAKATEAGPYPVGFPSAVRIFVALLQVQLRALQPGVVEDLGAMDDAMPDRFPAAPPEVMHEGMPVEHTADKPVHQPGCALCSAIGEPHADHARDLEPSR